MDYVNSRSASLGAFGRLVSLFADLRAAAERQATFRRTVAVLNAMSDRDLADIGVSRVAIEDVARESAHKR